MLYREWKVGEPDRQKADALAAETGAGRLLCDILVARGMDTPEAAGAILDTGAPLPSPFLLTDMGVAVERIHRAVAEGEPMVVFGDYDVDGITSTALLYTYLESLGADVFYKLPSRSDSGYGLTEELVEQVAGHGITLIITVDNGTSAFEAAEKAQKLGVDIVVTDHHLPQGRLPKVAALVNPCREDDESGYSRLSGVGVTFMLVAAMEDCTPEELLPVFGDLVAIGTVADVMKLVGENRILVRTGLSALRESDRPGLAALIEACGWDGKDITVENISYGLAPRLNAAGRMDDATDALRLLLAEDEEEARELVDRLQEQNAARQKAEQEITQVIAAQIDSDPALQRARVLVVWGEGWHQGVIGIVASRLAERYAKPAIVISLEGEEGRGSGRSFAGFSLYGAIASCSDILVRFGGHDLAAGLSIHPDKLEEFRRRINDWAVENCPVFALPALHADLAVELDGLDIDEVRQLDRLAPCGSGNPAPRFLLRDAAIEAVYPVSEGKHCRLRLRQGRQTIYAVMFGTGPDSLAYRQGDKIDALVSISIYAGKMGEQLSARIIDLRPAGLGDGHVEQSALFESFVAGGRLPDEQREKLAPCRDDTAVVYRAVRGEQPVPAADLRPVFHRLSPLPAGRVLASLAALEELGLVRVGKESGCYEAVRVEGKRDLSSSLLLQRLGVG